MMVGLGHLEGLFKPNDSVILAAVNVTKPWLKIWLPP